MNRKSRIEIEEIKNKYKDNISQPTKNKVENKQPSKISSVLNIHRRQESDSKMSSPFFRGFRRENSDLFPLSSTRHSAIYIPKSEPPIQANPLRSSGIFNNSRKPARGEPVLTEFIKMNDSLKMSNQGEIKKIKKDKHQVNKNTENTNNSLKNIGLLPENKSVEDEKTKRNDDSPTASISSSIAYTENKSDREGLRTPSEFIAEYLRRPRREKTESDIVYRNSILARDQQNVQVIHTSYPSAVFYI